MTDAEEWVLEPQDAPQAEAETPLRFVERDGERILQWLRMIWSGECSRPTREWRDVPLVAEDAQ